MKKIVRITESEINNIVKKVLKEEHTADQYYYHGYGVPGGQGQEEYKSDNLEKSDRREDSLSKSYKVSDNLDYIRNEIMMNIKGAYKEHADYIMNQIKGKTISFNLGRDEGVAEDVKVQMSNRHRDIIEISIKIDGLWRELRSSIEIKD
jgi:hypothetical protein